MSLCPHSRLLVVLVLVVGGTALAQRRQLQQFEGAALTQEEREAARSRPRYNIHEYGKDVPVESKPIPWMAIGLASLVLLAATPFALKMYQETRREIADAHTFGVAGRSSGEEEE
jgi:hypothetical protein